MVDDTSPDGTGEVADELVSRFSQVTVIHRKGKGGRGGACMEGFKYALGQNFDYIFEMDADFSHHPGDIPIMLEKIKGCDVVIGSRYLKESKIVDWGIERTIFSRFANFYARMILGIPTSDYTNGYRCYRRAVLEDIDWDKIGARGYIVLSEMAYQIFQKGYTFGEVPIVFVNRRRGESNLTLKEIINAFVSVLRVKWK
ncbi:MAG: polyprenol monophosphomannose synthase [bacterium]|nr:polyprenol monophosphomannose synthase [bacterium]